MTDKRNDNRSDRSRRDEPLSEIKKQLLDAEPEVTGVTGVKREQNGEVAFRPDQVPGHLGYSTSDNQINVNPTNEEF